MRRVTDVSKPRGAVVKAARAAVASISESAPWLLLVHQIPPKPDYFRAKVGRRLQRVGAVAVKNSVYVLPKRDDTYEDLQWVLREIVEEGGEAMLCEARFVEGLTDEQVSQLFRAARDADYTEILEEARGLLEQLQRRGPLTSTDRQRLERELAKLRRRVEFTRAIDFFAAPVGDEARNALAELHAGLRDAGDHPRAKPRATSTRGLRRRTWVTRRDVHVDRIASAWLIRRFIDTKARFKFVDPAGYRPSPGELRFDMYEAEYTHEGDDCTFETLLNRSGLDDQALREVAEIVHDVDLKDKKYGREEATGVARMIAGIARAHERDETRLERGGTLFETLYASFGGRGRDQSRRPSARRSSPVLKTRGDAPKKR